MDILFRGANSDYVFVLPGKEAQCLPYSCWLLTLQMSINPSDTIVAKSPSWHI